MGHIYGGPDGEYSGGDGDYQIPEAAQKRGLRPPRDASHTLRAGYRTGTDFIEEPYDELIFAGNAEEQAKILQQRIDQSYHT